MSEEWFRNTSWNETIARRFHEKLHRARRKGQYLRIQAFTLASTNPEIALALLDEYFVSPGDVDRAQAYEVRATALLALGRTEAAIESYEAALRWEAEFPSVQTQAYLDLPFLIAVRGIEGGYGQAVALLEKHKARVVFPVERFRWHAAQCLILAARGDSSAAKLHAQLALEAAQSDHSGFRYHASLGLVGEQYQELRSALERCLDA